MKVNGMFFVMCIKGTHKLLQSARTEYFTSQFILWSHHSLYNFLLLLFPIISQILFACGLILSCLGLWACVNLQGWIICIVFTILSTNFLAFFPSKWSLIENELKPETQGWGQWVRRGFGNWGLSLCILSQSPRPQRQGKVGIPTHSSQLSA